MHQTMIAALAVAVTIPLRLLMSPDSRHPDASASGKACLARLSALEHLAERDTASRFALVLPLPTFDGDDVVSLCGPLSTEEPAPQTETVLNLVEQAQARVANHQWREAAAFWERIVRLNPVQPRYWNALGDAYYRAEDYHAAVPAYEKAMELGTPIMGEIDPAAYNVICCHALVGEKELAIKALERALSMGFPDLGRSARDPKLASLREDPRVKKMLWLEDVSKMSREEGWRYDLSLLASEVRRKGFLVYRPITLAQFEAKLRDLSKEIPKFTDAQAVLALQKLVAFLADGHSTVLPGGENPVYKLTPPIQFYWFAEGLFVISADPKYKDLLGAQVLEFDGRPVDAVLETMTQYVSRDRGNPIWPKQIAPYLLRHFTLLHAAGLIKNPERVTLHVRDFVGAERDISVVADATQPNIWNQLPNPRTWVNFASTLGTPPLYLRDMGKHYWFEQLPDRKTVYFQYNKVLDEEAESLAKFTERLFRFIEENDVNRLIIDMRWNNGGNTSLSHPLLLALVGNRKINQRGKLFVIIGRRTYSAAQNTATYIERYTNATFVGEPTGSSPNFVGEEFPVTLPFSKLVVNVSHLFWQSSVPQDQRIWLAPQVYVPPTFADFRSGRDAALDAIASERHER